MSQSEPHERITLIPGYASWVVVSLLLDGEGDVVSLNSNNTTMQFFNTNVEEISRNLDETLAKVEEDVENNFNNNTPASGEDRRNKGSNNNKGGTGNGAGKNNDDRGTIKKRNIEGTINAGGI